MATRSDRRRIFLKQSLTLAAISTVGPLRLLGKVQACDFATDASGTIVNATFRIKVSDFPSFALGTKKIGLTEVGSSIKLLAIEELEMNPDHCDRSGRDGNCYPIAVVRVKESGTDAFTAVSTWCPHNDKSQLSYFDHTLGENGMFVCDEHEHSCFRADGTWIPPAETPFTDSPPKNEFKIASHKNPDGTPFLLSFPTEFDGVDTLTISNILCECGTCIASTTGTEATEAAGLVLNPNYPNPVHEQTIIDFAVPHASNVELSLLTVTGETVRVLMNEHRAAGHHQVIFDGRLVPAGTYFYRLRTADGTKTRRMTIVR